MRAGGRRVLFVGLDVASEATAASHLEAHGLVARFAADERAAEAALDREPAAAVVCCTHPSCASTLELLRLVRQRSPGTARMVVVGDADLAALTDAINRQIIHRLVAAPFDAEELRGALDRARADARHGPAGALASGRT